MTRPPGWGDAAAGAARKSRDKKQLAANRQVDIDAEEKQLHEKTAQLAGLLVEAGVPGLVAEQLVGLVMSTRPDWAYCPECRLKVKADFPDRKAQLQAVQTVLGYLIGKPKERKEIDVSVSQKPLHEMSLEEKRAELAKLRSLEVSDA